MVGWAADLDESRLESDVRPFINKYCVDCHSVDEAKGGIRLDDLPKPADFVLDRPRWSKVVGQIKAKGMPPQDADQPPDDVRTQVARWLTSAMNNIDCSGPRPAGKPTIRRLNRVEYNNTLRDLLAIDFKPAENFPADDVGEGFDNIGDVLSISPLLLEKYLEASQQVAERAIALPVEIKPIAERIEGEYARSTAKGQTTDNGKAQVLTTPGELYKVLKFQETGDYRMRLRAYGQQVGDEPVKAAIKIDENSPQQILVPATADNPSEYEVTIRIEKGKRRVAISFLNDYFDEATSADRNLIVDYLQIDGPSNIDSPPLPRSHQIIFFQPIRPESADQDIRATIERFASRAYRRPATSSEVDRLAKLVQLARDQKEPIERGMQLVVEAVLASPHFLFKVEQDGEGSSTEPRELNDFELATRLSYFLWSSMPDDRLLELAREGKLRDEVTLSAEIDRMLADDKVLAFVENFAGQWLQLRNLDVRQPDKDRFPQFTEKLRGAMRRETELFFASVLRERKQLSDFLSADYTFVNEPLAKLYGIEGVTGEEFQRVSLADKPRGGGVLTHASVLTITSDPTRTSPVKRGKWVMETILGSPPPAAPADVPELDKQQLTGTLRQRMEQHRANPACATCHDLMDPLGFGLENFDAIGQWRDKDGEYPVDASGKLPDGPDFNGPRDLSQKLAQQKDLFLRTITEKILVYALGRGLELYDECEIIGICQRVTEKGGHLADVVREIALSRPFRFRGE
jgi:hypothetical protein